MNYKMKKVITVVSILMFGSWSLIGQNEKFFGIMKRNIAILDTAQKVETLSGLVNTFERIANAEKKEWTAYYYTAYAILRKAYAQQAPNKNDESADQAEKFIKIADSLNPNNSEISCLKSMNAGLRMMVDPMTRGQKYGMESGMWLAKAKEQDPTNPRPYLLSGQAKLFTPPQWGGGKDKALVEFDAAQKLFDAFKPNNEVYPNWGKSYNELLTKKAKE